MLKLIIRKQYVRQWVFIIVVLTSFVWLAGCVPVTQQTQQEISQNWPTAVLHTSPASTSGTDVADLLGNRPAPGAAVEIDAYFSGANAVMFPSLAEIVPGPTCPGFTFNHYLTDRPVLPALQVLGRVSSTMLTDDEPWLIAVKPELNSAETPSLPHYGRLHGHLGDPLFADCPQPERIFVVDEILAVYVDQPPPPLAMWPEKPAGFEQWPRYEDRQLGFSIAYPPDWTAEPLVEAALLGGVVLRPPEHPTYPVFVRVHEGETHWDYFDPFNEPPLLQESLGRGVFEQGGMIWSWPDSQHLSGLQIDREAGEDEYSMAILFSSNGRTYEIAITYPTGFNASQELLTNYSTIEESFRLDVLPGPSPTPPINQELGAGPFIGRMEAETAALAQNETPGEFEIIDAQLIPEAEARRLVDDCELLPGHPEGVWMVRGQDAAGAVTIDWFLNATTGEMLIACSDGPSPTPDPNITFPTLPPDVSPPPTPAP